MNNHFTLGKQERLKSRKLIDALFKQGKSVGLFPFRVCYMKTGLPTACNLQAGVTVSKKYFKKAVDRNRIKRLTREAYRQKKHILQSVLQSQDVQLAVFFVYTGKTLPSYVEITEKMEIILQKLSEQFVPGT